MKKRKKGHYYDAEGYTYKPALSRLRAGDYRLVMVYVEGYDDVAFWRGVFDDYETDRLRFEISVPPRHDLAKGKRVLMEMIPHSGEDLILCVDSDFDYLFDGATEQSRLVTGSPFLFHTYAYATENYLCYPPSLHRVCARATKNDAMIFDFEAFLAAYSQIIYPVFLWYAYSARRKTEKSFTLLDFRSTVRLNYLDLRDDGAGTLGWLKRQVDKRLGALEAENPQWIREVEQLGDQIAHLGVAPTNTYLFMQGHTLMDNVIMILLNAVCEKLREMTTRRISQSSKQGTALKNEVSNYNNSLRNVREVLLDNEHYKECFLYHRLRTDIETYIGGLK